MYKFFKKIKNDSFAYYYLGLAGSHKVLTAKNAEEKEEGHEWIGLTLKYSIEIKKLFSFASAFNTLPHFKAAGPIESWFLKEVINEHFGVSAFHSEIVPTYFRTLRHFPSMASSVYDFGIKYSTYPEQFFYVIEYLPQDQILKLLHKIFLKYYEKIDEKFYNLLRNAVYILSKRKDRDQIIKILMQEHLLENSLSKKEQFVLINL